jgi:ATP-dependent helicase/nuclease subunit A
VHAALQRVDLADPVDLVAVVARAAEAEGCAEFVDVVESAARAAVAAPIVREAVESAAFYRELPLTLLAGRGFVEGVVDLCFESEDGTVIVDYKTDVVADKAHAVERAVRYRLQAAAYALALGEITGRRVARVVLLFLAPPDGAIEVPMIDLDVAITEVRGSVEETLVAHPKILGHDRGR